MALLDNGAQINTIMPNYVKSCSLEVGQITDLIGRRVFCIGLGNAYTQPLSDVIVKVQVDGVLGYNEDQIALIVLDLSNLAERIPIILGTPTVSHIVNVMKERENRHLSDALGKCQGGYLLSVWRAAAKIADDQATEVSGPDEYNKVVVTKNMETVDAFSSCVIPVKVEKGLHRGAH